MKLDRWGRIDATQCDKIVEPITAFGITYTGHNTYSRVCKTCPDYNKCSKSIMDKGEAGAKRILSHHK